MVSLCWEHKLFDAMIYIYNQGMNDYLTPLRKMMLVSWEPVVCLHVP